MQIHAAANFAIKSNQKKKTNLGLDKNESKCKNILGVARDVFLFLYCDYMIFFFWYLFWYSYFQPEDMIFDRFHCVEILFFFYTKNLIKV